MVGDSDISNLPEIRRHSINTASKFVKKKAKKNEVPQSIIKLVSGKSQF